MDQIFETLMLFGFFGFLIWFIFRRRKELKKLKTFYELAKANQHSHITNQPILIRGTASGGSFLRSAFSQTPVVASGWSISEMVTSGKHSSWEIMKSGSVGDSVEITDTGSGRKFKINLNDHVRLEMEPVEFSTRRRLFSKPDPQLISKIEMFVQSNQIELNNEVGLDNIFGGKKKIMVSEWNIVSNSPYTVLGTLGSDNRILGTEENPVYIYAKNSDEIFKKGSSEIRRSYLLSGLVIFTFSLIFFGTIAMKIDQRKGGKYQKIPEESQKVSTGFLQESSPIASYDVNATFVDGGTEENDNFQFWNFFSSSKINVTVHDPIELDNLKKTEILDLRSKTLSLILKNFSYKPYPIIFDGIKDELAWWGWEGLLFFDQGPKANAGPSVRSFSIVNPLSLITPLIWENALIMNKEWTTSVNNFTDDQLKNFLYQPRISSLEVDVPTKTISVHFRVKEYVEYISNYMKHRIESGIALNLEAVNARDLGYSFILLDSYSTKNMRKIDPIQNLGLKTIENYEIGSSCGQPSGCNSLGPKQDNLAGYVIEKLPAVMQFKLWHHKPTKFGDPSDITYKIFFD